MALVWQMYRPLVNLPNLSSCFSKFIKSFIYISGIQRGRNRPRGRFYVLLGRFCDLPDLGAISVSKGVICAG